ncbi:MAG: hypothetical protein ACI7YS_17340 [Flavobacterium sp.]
MKNFKSILILSFFISLSVQAQYGNYNRYGAQNGMQNNIPSQPASKPSAEEIEKERTERIEKYMERLKSELSLDELQYIAIKNEIVANSKRIDIIMKKEMPDDAKAQEIDYQVKKIEADVSGYLNDDQKEKYKLILAEKNSKKKSKADKDKNKDKKD